MAVAHGSLGHTGFNNIHQLECSLNGLFLPGFYNIGGNAAAEFFLPIAVKNIRQRSLVISIDHIRGAAAGLAHTHIQRRVLMEGEAPLRRIQLKRADSQIQQHTIYAAQTPVGQYVFNICKIVVYNGHIR